MSYSSAKARLEAATTGEWSWTGNDIETDDWIQTMPMEITVECFSYCYGGSAKVSVSDANREFIVHTKQDLEAALEVVAAVRFFYSWFRSGDVVSSGDIYDLKKALDKFEALP